MLQSWATASNPMYNNGFKPALTYALGAVNAAWSWSFAGKSGDDNADGASLRAHASLRDWVAGQVARICVAVGCDAANVMGGNTVAADMCRLF